MRKNYRLLVFSAACFAVLTSSVAAEPTLDLAQSPSQPTSPIGPTFFANDPCTSISAIVTRPTVTYSVCTVRPDHVLIETGYQNTSSPGFGNTVTYPQSFVRIGTAVRGVEIDLSPPSSVLFGAGSGTSGESDTGFGVKAILGATPRFSYGLQALTSLPTGSNGITATGSNYSGATNFSYALSPIFSFNGTMLLQSTTNGQSRWGQFIPSLYLDASLPHATGFFVEIAGFTNAIGSATPMRTQYLVGATRALSQRFQLDIERGFSPTISTGKYSYVGIGAEYYL